MRVLNLYRSHRTTDGVFGRLGPWTTVEEEDLANRQNVSCIPAGAYVCLRDFFRRGGYETFEVTGVEGRERILFHRGNTEEDSDGCILIASRLGVLEVTDEDHHRTVHKLAGLASRDAFEAFMLSLEGVDEFLLIVEWVGD
jgi:hypothetical protein